MRGLHDPNRLRFAEPAWVQPEPADRSAPRHPPIWPIGWLLDDISLRVSPGPHRPARAELAPARSTLPQNSSWGLLRVPQAGTGTVLGHSARRDRLASAAKIGFMPEADALVPGIDRRGIRSPGRRTLRHAAAASPAAGSRSPHILGTRRGPLSQASRNTRPA